MTKRFFALLMAVVMVLALSVPAFADDVNYPTGKEVTITVPAGRAYEIYQIFTGDLAAELANGETSEEVLSNIKWGANGTGTQGETVADTVLEALTADFSGASDTDKLAVIEQYVDLNSNAAFTIAAGDTTATVPVGYYLIKDMGTVAAGDTYSLNVVEVVGPTKITPKDGTTESEKTVDDVNDSNTEVILNGDSADYDIGDIVPFTLTATVASDFANYVKAPYTLTFHDKEDAGLEFDATSVVVTNSNRSEAYEAGKDYILVTSPSDSCTFEIQFKNLNGYDEDTKKIDSTKALAAAGDVITVKYNAKLGDGAVIGSTGNKNEMYVQYSNKPSSDQGGETGTTPPDVVIVFTYKVLVDKVDQDEKPLAGAKFTLLKWIEETESYKTVTEDVEAAPNGDKFTSSFIGVDDGKYKLVESVTPAGYNTAPDLEFTITATHSTEQAVTELKEITITGATASIDKADGSIELTIQNNQGSVLPETGGIGTTIFYVVGAVLVVGAAVILFAKKKVEE